MDMIKDLFLIRPARPRPWAGIRVALSITMPCVVVYSFFLAGVIPVGTGLPTPANTWFNIVTWVVIGSLLTALVVNDGTLQEQAVRFGVTSVFVLVGVWIGSVASLSLIASLIVAFAWGLIAAFAGLIRSSDGLMHLAVTVPIVVGFSLPITSSDNQFFAGQSAQSVVWSRLGWMVIGILWSAVVALVIRALQGPGDVAGAAVQQYWHDVAAQFRAVVAAADERQGAEGVPGSVQRAQDQALASGRTAAGSVSSLALFGGDRRRRELSWQYSLGERIDRVTTVVRTLLGQLAENGRQDVIQSLQPALEQYAAAIDAVAAKTDSPLEPELAAADRALESAWESLPEPHGSAEQERRRAIVAALAIIEESVRAASRNAGSPGDPPRAALPTTEDLGDGAGFLARVRANLHWNSDVLRHGIRLGTALLLMVVVYTVFDLPVPLFLSLAIIATVQPDVGASLTSGVRIGLCTVIGSVIAAVVIVVFPNEWLVMACLAVFAFLAFTFSRYAPVILFACLTPIFILLFTFNALGDWDFAVDRVEDTAVGVAIGLVVCLVLWPRGAAQRWVPTYGQALRAVGDCAETILSSYAQSPDSERGAQIRPAMVAAVRAQRALHQQTQLLAGQPRMLQAVGPLAIAADGVLAGAIDSLHVVASGTFTPLQRDVTSAGDVLANRYVQIAEAVEGWRPVAPASTELADLRDHPAGGEVVSPAVDHSIHELLRAAEASAGLVEHAVDLSPHGPLGLRNRDFTAQT